jgi:hypothetical protein
MNASTLAAPTDATAANVTRIDTARSLTFN